jgi:branched-chain amino acid transport system permease protein
LNLAHGAMFMLGGYAGYVAYQATGSFVVAVIAGTLFMLVVGVVMERVHHPSLLRSPHEDQLLVTFGLAIVFVEVVRLFFSSQSLTVPAPAALSGITSLGVMFYPTYRLAVVGIVAVALLVLFVVLYRPASA